MSVYSPYIPYTLGEIEANISAIYTEIIANRGISDGERIKNGNDEYVSGDILSTLEKELQMWEGLRERKMIELGQATGKSFYISGQYGV